MDDKDKTQNQLLRELGGLRKRYVALESRETEHRKHEEALRKSEERFRRMADNIKDGLAIVENHKTVYVNKRLCEISGYTEEELKNRGSMKMLTPESRKMFQKIFDRYKKTGIIPTETEYEIIRKDGKRRTIHNRHSVSRNGDKILGYYDILTDVTERRRAEEALKKSQQQLRGIIDNSISAISVKDATGCYVLINHAFEKEFGIKNKDIIGKTDFDFLSPEEAEKNSFQEDRVIKTGTSLKTEEELSWNGSRKTFIITKFALFDSEKKPYAVCVMSTDISQRKLAEEKLKTLNQELEQRVQERTAELTKTNERLKKEIAERKHAEAILKANKKELQTKTNTLEEFNAALRVLLKKREDDKAELKEQVLDNVKSLVLPYLERLTHSKLDPQQRECLDIAESNLNEIISPFVHRLSSSFINLTPQELKVANLIREGKTTKDVALFLNLSIRTVDTHRENIRRKLGINNEKTNLRTYLQALQ